MRAHLALAAVSLIAACSNRVAVVTPVPTAGTGTLTVTWTLQGARDPNLCAVTGASLFQLTVFDAAGNVVATPDAPCGSFSTAVELVEDVYSADAVLTDSAGRHVTSTLHLSDLHVVANTDLASDIDFPTTSFL